MAPTLSPVNRHDLVYAMSMRELSFRPRFGEGKWLNCLSTGQAMMDGEDLEEEQDKRI